MADKDETFIMVNLDDIKSKELAQSISNETARKILDYLSKVEEASESDLAEKLKVPISTIHYNLKNLKKAGLIESKEFIWSPKGKEISLYKLSKKLIVIVPKGASKIKESLKTLLPVTFITAIGSGLFYYLNRATTTMGIDKNLADNAAANIFSQINTESSEKMMVATAEMAGASADEAARNITSVSQDQIKDVIVNDVINRIPEQNVHEPNIALWFLFGALVAIVLVFVFMSIRKRKN